MMTVRELLNALESGQGDYASPVVVIRRNDGRAASRYRVESVTHKAKDTADPNGACHIVIVRD